jgi:nucleotide-binding universal stress UspA family protein
MKNVLVLLHDGKGQDARLQAALDLTRAVSGHLLCLDVLAPPAVLTDYFDGGGALVMEYVRERESENRSQVEARLRKEDVAWTMLDAIGAPGKELRDASELADVIVVSAPGSDADLDARRLAAEVAVKSGRPVLAVPPSCTGLDVAGEALVAWDGSREANQALRAAVPLLQRAAAVTLLEVNVPTGELTIDDAAGYLSRYDIHAEVVDRSTAGSASDAILDEAHAIGAAYLVMGAYGHPRAVEAIFGGVTADVLAGSDLPILLAH